MPDSPDVNALKRRSRRRLVGAIALVLLAVIVLPMVFDQDPRPPAAPVGVRIPSEDDTGFTPKVTSRGDAAAKAPAPPESAAPTPVEPAVAQETGEKVTEKPAEQAMDRPSEQVAEKAAEKPTAKPPAPEETRRAENALANTSYVVAIGTYADEKNARTLVAKLKSEKIPAYAEPLETAKGPRTRVRAGPFPTEEAAEKARTRMQRLGVQAGAVVPKAE